MPEDNNQGQQGQNGGSQQKGDSNYASEMWDQINKSAKKSDQKQAGEAEAVEQEKKPEVKPINPFEAAPPIPQAEEVVAQQEPTEMEPDVPVEKPEEVAVEAQVVEEPVEAEVEPVADEKPEVVDVSEGGASEMESFKEDFWDILEQAGITKKVLAVFGGVVVVIAIGLFLLLSGVFSGGDDDIVVEKDDSEKVQEDEDTKVDKEVAADAVGVVSAYIFGEEFKADGEGIETLPIGVWGDVDAIDNALEIGGVEADLTNRFVYYLNLLQELQNIYSTDVYEMLDVSVDRRKALDNYLKLMNGKIVEAEVAYNDINSLLGQLDAKFESVVAEKNLHEELFFSNTQALKAGSAFENLEQFKALSAESLDIKASFNAYKVLGNMYLNSLNALRPRYQDVVVNFEAVIKGVRVFDVPGSDIQAIIRLSR